MSAEDLSWANLIDWTLAFGDGTEREIPWLVEGFIEQGQLAALYGGMKAGKSLLVQDISAALASGRSVMGLPQANPVSVLYLDFENQQELITERLRLMGYGPADLALLRYASYPALSNLDTPEGGDQACRLASACAAQLVVIDTTSRIVGGAENSADTFADLYRYTLLGMKRAGHTVLRIDHEGKDADRGQRGSSAKGADVDILWHLTAEGQGGDELRLVNKLDRARHAAPFRVRRLDGPLRHVMVAGGLTAAQDKLTGELDRLGVPRDASRSGCRAAMKAAGITARNVDLAAVIRHRKMAAGSGGHGTAAWDSPGRMSGGTSAGTAGQMAPDLVGQDLGQVGQPTWDNAPTRSVGQSSPAGDHDWAELYSLADFGS